MRGAPAAGRVLPGCKSSPRADRPKHACNIPGGCFTARKHSGLVAETPRGEGEGRQGALGGGSDEAHHRRDQAVQAGRGEGGAAGLRSTRHDGQRGERVRPPAGPHRGVPRRGIRGGPGAQGPAGRALRRRGRRRSHRRRGQGGADRPDRGRQGLVRPGGRGRAGAHRRTRPRGALTAGRPGPGRHAMPERRAAAFGADRARRAAETDRWLASLLGDEAGVALVAVGGYGRRELLPGSDLDVLLLHAGRPDISGLADRIWYPIWDSGTRLDHAVRTPREGREVARGDLRAALGLLYARHVAGDPGLTAELRHGVLADWRAAAGTRLAELQALHTERTRRSGELAFLLEPDLKEARGGLRDAHAIHAVAAAWVAPGPGPRVRAAHEFILDTRHALHEVTGRPADRLVLQEQDEVARVLGLADADALLGRLAGAGRTVAYALDQSFRQAQRGRGS